MGGCACVRTPDACATARCTLVSANAPDGAIGFACRNGPLGFRCTTNMGGRCVDVGSACLSRSSLPTNDCDTWPSTGAFCCLDPVDAGDRGCPTECSVDTDCANCGLPDGCTGRNACVSGICFMQATCPAAGDSGVDAQRDAADGGITQSRSQDDADLCVPFDAATWNCAIVPCPAGTVCSVEIGSAGPPTSDQSWCIPIPPACKASPTCACMGACACTHAVNQVLGDQCFLESDGSIMACDNGLR